MSSFDPHPIIVSDVLTGAAMFTLPPEQIAQLKASVDALYDGKLYLRTTEQHPVVDVATGQIVTADSERYPLGAVDKWTYSSDGSLEPAPEPERTHSMTIRLPAGARRALRGT